MVKKEYDALWSIYNKMVNPDIYERIGDEICVELTDYELSLAKKLMHIPTRMSLKYGNIENISENPMLPCSLIHCSDKNYICIFDDLYGQTKCFRFFLNHLKADFQLNYQRFVKSIYDIDLVGYDELKKG